MQVAASFLSIAAADCILKINDLIPSSASNQASADTAYNSLKPTDLPVDILMNCVRSKDR